jgi:protein-L-isoaspartate(D-aspartate) O-methyltransferase
MISWSCIVLLAATGPSSGCTAEQAKSERAAPPATASTAGGGPDARFQAERTEMVEQQIASRGVSDEVVLRAMRKVPRHEFVPQEMVSLAYSDQPLPIGSDQTISQPYIVAFMVDALDLEPSERVLEIGTGSGYHAAVIAEIAREVYTIEIISSLAERASKTLSRLGYDNVHVRAGDGYEGWPEAAPFDAIVVTAAPDHVPQPLVDQLRVGGRMIIPVGDAFQELRLIRKTPEGVREEATIPVRFVPMTGKAEREP